MILRHNTSVFIIGSLLFVSFFLATQRPPGKYDKCIYEIEKFHEKDTVAGFRPYVHSEGKKIIVQFDTSVYKTDLKLYADTLCTIIKQQCNASDLKIVIRNFVLKPHNETEVKTVYELRCY